MPAGRPRIEVDKKQFENLCALQCTREEIAGFFNCSEDTIERWCGREYGENFAVVFAKKRVGGKISLRRSQFRLAEKSAAMAIWLGKQYLGQHDEDIRASAEASNGVLEAILALERNGVKQ